MAFKENQIVEKLNNTNFATWKFKTQMLLIKEDLEDHITQEPPDPITQDWRKKDNKARALINLVIEDSQIIHIKNLNTARETWQTLSDVHERKNLSSKLYLLRKLYSAKLEEKGNLITHMTNILQLVDKLKSIGENISASHVSALLLCSLPRSYDNLVTALEARPEDELTPEFIRDKLTDEFNRRTESSSSSENHNRAFQAQNKYSNTNKKGGNKFCTYCKLRNHNNAECWHLKKIKTNKYKNNTYRNNTYKSNSYTSSLAYENEHSTAHRKEHNEDNTLSDRMKNVALLTNSVGKNNKWIIDSGSTTHITNNKNLLHDFTDNEKSEVIIANGNSLTSYGSGKIKATTKISNGEVNNITLKNVLYVPDLETNLLSVKQATANGCKIIFEKDHCHLTYKGNTYLEGSVKNNLYQTELQITENKNYAATVQQCSSPNCITLWHRRLGHKNIPSIKQISEKQLADDIKINKCVHNVTCESCIESKLTDAPYPKIAQNRATHILELIHSDLCGPLPVPTIGGKNYVLTFIDDFSRYTVIYFLTHKSEVLTKFKEYVNYVNNKFGKIPESIRSDNGGEYTSDDFNNYLKELGTQRQLTVVYSSSQNGVAERKNRSLIEMARTMLNEANLNKSLWGEAVNTANYLQNRLPTKATDKTPYELWTGKKPKLNHLRVFGCKVYVYINKTKRNKLENKAEEAVFVGYDNNTKGYRVCTQGKFVSVARTVKFLENTMSQISNKNVNKDTNHETELNTTQITTNPNLVAIPSDTLIDDTSDTDNTQNNPHNTQPRRSERSNRGVPPDRFSYLTQSDIQNDPKDWEELIDIKNPTDKKNWLEATKEEINSLKLNNTWVLVDPPPNRKVIGCKWTFKSKLNSKGEIEKYKARLVAKGFSQKYGTDYDETYAPVVSYTTLRAFLVKASSCNLNINHIDVKTAFLHGELNEEVYMQQPDGYIEPGQENKVCKLQKAIYGLKQAARAWHTKISNTLKNLGFIPSEAENCLFIKNENGEAIYIIIYVDDLLIAGKQEDINKTIADLQSEYDMKNLGEISYYLGIRIRKTNNGDYAISQSLKIKELVKTHDLEDAKPVSTPLEVGYEKVNNEENLLPNNHQYRRAIGSLLYIGNITRPDINSSVNILSRRIEKPRQKDWNQVKRIIKYLKTTINFELILSAKINPILTVYADADWGGDTNDRKSTSGSVFFLDKTPINWITKKQTTVALSSAEAEYISAATATQEILWILNLLNDLNMKQQMPIILFEDNQSTIKMTENTKNTLKTKHIQIKYHHIRNLKESGIIDLKYCATKMMIADILTKALPKSDFQRHREALQLQSLELQERREEC